MTRTPNAPRALRGTVKQLTLHEAVENALVDHIDIADSKGKAAMIKGKLTVGYTVASAAAKLGVSRQRIYELIRAGRLEAFEVVDDARAALGIMIRTASLERFAKSERKPGRRAVRSHG